MINWLNSADADFVCRLKTLRTAPVADVVVQRRVAAILRAIRRDGDTAILEAVAKFDDWQPATVADLEVPSDTMQRVVADLDDTLRHDLQTVVQRLQDYSRYQVQSSWEFTDSAGNIIGETVQPVARAVIYAPGGKAAYPSSVLMGVVPAKTAGVGEVIVTTPAHDGEIPATTLAAAQLAGADRVFKLGGAHAIAAFAYGTNALPQADVIVGPGNAYVAEAKRQVFGLVGIESIAGPSEVLIISDSSVSADWVAADMLAQAEHDEDAQSIVLSCDVEHLRAVQGALETQLSAAARQGVIADSLKNRGALITAQNSDDCIRIANDIAAEHLQLMTVDAQTLAMQITNAGSIFVGRNSCVALGDYVAGPNHVLPTGGTARFASPLGVQHFIKRSGYLQATDGGVASLAAVGERLASAEGLPAHAASAKRRIL